MSKFTRPLTVSPLSDGKKWVLRDSFSYDVGYKGSDETITVPLGFVTDFASIPRAFWALLPRWGKYGTAAVVHDYLYWDQSLDRKKVDDIFLEGMEVLEVGKWTRMTIYNAVRLFGGFAWRHNTKEKNGGKNKIIDLSEWEKNESVDSEK